MEGNTLEPIISFILSSVAKALVSKLTGKVSDGLLKKLKGDPAKKALKKALGAAIELYANSSITALKMAEPLLKRKSLLSQTDVAAELAEVVCFVREPDYKLIGNIWKEEVDTQLKDLDFTEQAQILVEYFKKELRGTDVFRPVFDTKSLDAIAAGSKEMTVTLDKIETNLEGLTALLDSRFCSLIDSFTSSSATIRSSIFDFSGYIEEKTRGFIGRRWVFEAINSFIDKNSRGYFLIIGDPGIGKSALAAQCVKQNGYVHHFNIRAEGINKTSSFLKNISAQLIANYNLSYSVLPPKTTEDAGFFKHLLSEVSDKLNKEEHCVIIIDALDEAEFTDVGNILFLPLMLPENIYIVVTMRDDQKIKPHVECELDELFIKADSTDNLTDIEDLLKSWTVRTGIKEYLIAQRLEQEEFVKLMVQKSEGNFMYLRHVLPEIESGVYKKFNIEKIPSGLRNYYENHWKRIKGLDEESWFRYKLPVIVALTAVREPVSIELISDFSKVESKPRIRGILQEWSQFLHEEYIEREGIMQIYYRLYHNSFFDFIVSKQQVIDERVDLKAMYKQIADSLWKDVFDEE